MNSKFLRVMGVLMVIAAIVTAWMGYRISNKQPVSAVEVVVPSYSQVVARDDIPAGKLLTADDLELVSTQQYDKRTFSDPQELVGKVTVMAVIKGVPFKASHFPAAGAFAQALAANERAVAIKVNEVIGVGGFIKPGDYVDVLLYLRADRETGEVSSAQVVLSNVKVLAYGALITEPDMKQEDELTQPTSNKLGTGNSRADNKKEKDSRSAILAVADQDVSKLMLAESTGLLRLALRGGSLPVNDVTSSNQFIRLGDVAQPSGQQVSLHSKSLVAPSVSAVKKKSGATANTRERVIIHRGEKVEVVNVAR